MKRECNPTGTRYRNREQEQEEQEDGQNTRQATMSGRNFGLQYQVVACLDRPPKVEFRNVPEILAATFTLNMLIVVPTLSS